MQQLLIDIAKGLVTNPDAVVVTEKQNGDTLVLQLSVAPEDMGKVIGRQGKIARAIRSIVKASASVNNMRVIVDIV